MGVVVVVVGRNEREGREPKVDLNYFARILGFTGHPIVRT